MTNEEFIKSITLDGEEWRDVVEWEGLYMVSNLGRVLSKTKTVRSGDGYRTIPPRVMKQKVSRTGYCEIGFTHNRKRQDMLVHRLVARAFIPNPHNLPTIDHLDRNRQNNRIDNLRWCTLSENMLNPLTRSFRGDIYRGRKRPQIHKPVVSIKDNKVKHYSSVTSVTEDGFTICCVINCCTGRERTHKGYKWMYLSDYEKLLSNQ